MIETTIGPGPNKSASDIVNNIYNKASNVDKSSNVLTPSNEIKIMKEGMEAHIKDIKTDPKKLGEFAKSSSTLFQDPEFIKKVHDAFSKIDKK